MNEGDSEDKKLKWRFDISTFRLIGRELITDRITALFELVKNCYDANATRVDVVFENVSYDNAVVDDTTKEVRVNPGSKVVIEDNGYGMSFEDIRDKWMVIGTASKRTSPFSPRPFGRRCVGEKGIGRFAVDKLGDKVNIVTKKEEDDRWLNVEIDWNSYFNEVSPDEREHIRLFTDIENKYDYLDRNEGSGVSGTKLIVSSVREFWSKDDISRFYKEANKIVSPYTLLNPPFKIYITAREYGWVEKPVEPDKIDFATEEAEITYRDGIQETLYFDKDKGCIAKKDGPLRIFGGISLKIFYFDENARRNYYRKYKDVNNRIDGIKIYRDGIIATPFAEAEANPDRKRDILGIDKRLWQDIFNRISTREIIGILDITKDGNPKIIDATNRQDFIDNAVLSFLFCFIALIVNELGSIQAVGRMIGADHMERRTTRGVGITGLANVVSGALGIVGPVDYSMSPGIIAATGCASRFPLIPAGIGLVVCAFFPGFIECLNAIPGVVMGAVLLYLMASQLSAGMQMMIREKAVDGFDGGLVVGFSLMVALLLSFAPDEALNSIPALIRPIVGNGFVMGVITVLILEHLIFRAGKKAKKE